VGGDSGLSRPKHAVKELEAVLREMEAQGWRVKKLGKYYKGKCGCGNHIKTVRCTPSDPNYTRNLRGWLRRQECWNEEI